MARISRRVPKPKTVELFETSQKNKMFKWFEITAEPIGQMQLKQVREWVTDDGLVFRSADSARDYFLKRRKEQGKTIKPGEYHVDVDTVTQSPGRIELTTRDGETITIVTRRGK